MSDDDAIGTDDDEVIQLAESGQGRVVTDFSVGPPGVGPVCSVTPIVSDQVAPEQLPPD